jgi:predicted CXXCH cytochrome family protein
MKKLLIAFAICSLVVFALVTTVMADNGPHGSFTANTDASAGCHRVHSAQFGSNALLVSDPEALCISCHGTGGTLAFTNVVDGVYKSGSEGAPGNPLFGGGFDNALMATNWSGNATFDPTYNAVSRPTTSHHDLGTSSVVWGSGANNSTPGALTLECTSCHDPHGTAGRDASNNKVASYRLLRMIPAGSGGFTPPTDVVNWSGGAFPSAGWLITDTVPLDQEWYTLGTTSRFAVGDYNAGNANNVYNVKNPAYTPPATSTGNYIPQAIHVAFFCAQCHDRYFNNSRLRNATDASVFCGAPVAGVVVNGVTLTVYADADGAPPWLHPVSPTRCDPVTDPITGALTGWGDNGDSGDLTYKYRHSSGDIRLSMDGTVARGGGTSVSRSCVACHVAHGSSADMTALASGATLVPDVAPVGGNSVLLRMDNRSVCLRCHANTVNFTVGP